MLCTFFHHYWHSRQRNDVAHNSWFAKKPFERGQRRLGANHAALALK
jgi:hypothetical protein